MSWLRAAGLLLLVGLARGAWAEPFVSRAGTSGAFDVTDSEAMLLGSGAVAVDLRYWKLVGRTGLLSPSATLGLGLSHGLELGASVRVGGDPADPSPSPVLFGAAVKWHFLDAEGFRPGLAVQADLDRINQAPVPGLRLAASTELDRPFRLTGFGGAMWFTPLHRVQPLGGLAAIVTFRERYQLVAEGLYRAQGFQFGGGLRWAINERFGVSLSATGVPHTREVLAALTFSFKTELPVKKKVASEEKVKPAAEEPEGEGPVAFLDERPRFRLMVKTGRVPSAGGRHLLYPTPEPEPAPVAVAPEPAPVVVVAPPPLDTDGDTVPDTIDQCPTVPGPPENHGCPKPPRLLVIIHDNKIEVKEQVFFETARWAVKPRSFMLLTQVADLIKDHPELTRVRVEGHTDNVGTAAYNLDLSQHRAESVRTFLIEKGVGPERLEAKGYGLERPIASNNNAGGRSVNRRVEFTILERAGVPVAAPEPLSPKKPLAPAVPAVATQVPVRAPTGAVVAAPVSESLVLELNAKDSRLTAAQRAALAEFARRTLKAGQAVQIEARAPVGGGKLAETSLRAEEVEAQLRKAVTGAGAPTSVEVVRIPESKRIVIVVYALGPADGGVPSADAGQLSMVAPAAADAGEPGPGEAGAADAGGAEVVAPAAPPDAGQPEVVVSPATTDAGQPKAVPAATTDAGTTKVVAPAAPSDAGQTQVVPPATTDAGTLKVVAPAAPSDAGQPKVVPAATTDAGTTKVVAPAAPSDAGQPKVVSAEPTDAGTTKMVAPTALSDAGQPKVVPAATTDAGTTKVVAPAGPPDAGQPKAVVSSATTDAGQPKIVPAATTDAGQPKAVVSPATTDAGTTKVVAPSTPTDAGQPKVGPAASPDAGQPNVVPTATTDAGQKAVAPAATTDAGTTKVVAPAAPPDAGRAPPAQLDAGRPAASTDAGQVPAAQPDAGRSTPLADAGQPDAGRATPLADAGHPDAGHPDAGAPDAGQPLERLRTGVAGQEQLKTSLISHLPDIRRCVEHQLKRTPTLKADGLLQLTINRKGRVANARVRGDQLKGTFLVKCLMDDSRTWRFPAGDADYDLEVPLSVKSVEGSP